MGVTFPGLIPTSSSGIRFRTSPLSWPLLTHSTYDCRFLNRDISGDLVVQPQPSRAGRVTLVRACINSIQQAGSTISRARLQRLVARALYFINHVTDHNAPPSHTNLPMVPCTPQQLFHVFHPVIFEAMAMEALASTNPKSGINLFIKEAGHGVPNTSSIIWGSMMYKDVDGEVKPLGRLRDCYSSQDVEVVLRNIFQRPLTYIKGLAPEGCEGMGRHWFGLHGYDMLDILSQPNVAKYTRAMEETFNRGEGGGGQGLPYIFRDQTISQLVDNLGRRAQEARSILHDLFEEVESNPDMEDVNPHSCTCGELLMGFIFDQYVLAHSTLSMGRKAFTRDLYTLLTSKGPRLQPLEHPEVKVYPKQTKRSMERGAGLQVWRITGKGVAPEEVGNQHFSFKLAGLYDEESTLVECHTQILSQAAHLKDVVTAIKRALCGATNIYR
jgi:hypothetical protein